MNSVERARSTVLSRFIDYWLGVINEINENEYRFNLLDKKHSVIETVTNMTNINISSYEFNFLPFLCSCNRDAY